MLIIGAYPYRGNGRFVWCWVEQWLRAVGAGSGKSAWCSEWAAEGSASSGPDPLKQNDSPLSWNRSWDHCEWRERERESIMPVQPRYTWIKILSPLTLCAWLCSAVFHQPDHRQSPPGWGHQTSWSTATQICIIVSSSFPHNQQRAPSSKRCSQYYIHTLSCAHRTRWLLDPMCR